MSGGQTDRNAMGRRAFLKSLAERPKLTGAVAPSGKALTRLMASYVDPADPLPVLELGPGTGVVTEALIERGVAPGKIVAVEYNPDFCAHLAGRFPAAAIVEGDAYDLGKTLPAHQSGPFSAVVSSLPLVTRPYPVRQSLIEQALDRMAPGRPLIQFSYSLFPPVKPVAGRFTVTRSNWIFMNLPPARVWLYRRAS
jgi:phosphatidylethanolamine/phosphatidyl-N-methylethanolamine N-methyltransferase